MFWDILGLFLGRFGIFVGVLRRFGSFWMFWGCLQLFCDVLDHFGLFGGVFGPFGTFWNVLGLTRMFWGT